MSQQVIEKTMPALIDEILQAQKSGQNRGIASICSSHPWVLKAALQGTHPVLVESTCNQVNQFGGYTGMNPKAFVKYVRGLARDNDFPLDRLVLGGDHLGPNVWQNEPADQAMQKASDLVEAYVQAGYSKIHLDASMRLGDDPTGPLEPEVAALRMARLAKIAERTCRESGNDCHLRYVIGSEVPIPGGATQLEQGVSVTTVEAAQRTWQVTQAAFSVQGLASAWERVVALVVQPGVEFGSDFVLEYIPGAAEGLKEFSEFQPFIYEAHSTDYQRRQRLGELVRDHFAILKVGPGLTFAFREAVFSLALIENELFPTAERSNLMDVLERVMLRQPEYWQKYYSGDEHAQRLARKFSLSDRIRYYWSNPQAQQALEKLLQNLRGKNLPLTLLSQFMPVQTERLHGGGIAITPEALIEDRIDIVLEDYANACKSGA